MNPPIKSAVLEYLESGRAPFHMPGHKGRAALGLDFKMDITEVDGVDSLYHSQSVIKQCEEAFSRIYGTAGSFISAGGSTLCIQTMLALASHRGKKIIAGRMIHSSAAAAMSLLDMEPVWIYTPTAVSGQGISGLSIPVSSVQVDKMLKKNPDAAAVYITSPDYFGQMADIKAISEVCHSYDVPLLVDNAHGAHLGMFGIHPAQLGAAMCCDSLHKTLPVLTGGAILHIMDSRFMQTAKECMAVFGSTSPNYLIMLSIEGSLGEFEGEMPQRYITVADEISSLRSLAAGRGLQVLYNCEPMRLTIGYACCGWSDSSFGSFIRSCGVEPEYIGGGVCVLMASAYTTEEDFVSLKKALNSFVPNKNSGTSESLPVQSSLPRMCSMRSAMLSPRRKVAVKDSTGRTCAEVVSTCPPGIPLLVPGELITPAAVQMLEQAGIEQISVVV